ncbi:MAG: leucine-rich repeat domain-containing protein, partial [Sedimentisphaerales bacterium]|nr:leucine-rich repeat domain-containing protein [Sedimentisphaerales bacterium]
MAQEEFTQLNPGDQKILEKLQDLLGIKLEAVSDIQWNTRGYTVNQAGEVTCLGLYRCEIDDKKLQALVETISPLTSLTSLYLRDNQLSDISVLKELPNLTQLYLSDNQL